MIRVGILGISDGNGHPFSFSAIINGYSETGLAASGWPVIHEYVRRRHPSEFGIGGLRATHAWTQDPEVTRRLCEACLIDHAVNRPEEMIGRVDAVVLARDDHEQHRELAAPFLKAGLPVFIDKPLTLSLEDLVFFRPYLERGQLMSCSALRYAVELDTVRMELDSYGELRLVRGAVLNGWAKYGIHMLEPMLALARARPISVKPHSAAHESVAVTTDSGTLLLIDALGHSPKTFRIDVFGSDRCSTHDINDNFSMFRRVLWEFAEMIRTARPPIAPESAIEALKVLIAGRLALATQKTVTLDELEIPKTF